MELKAYLLNDAFRSDVLTLAVRSSKLRRPFEKEVAMRYVYLAMGVLVAAMFPGAFALAMFESGETGFGWLFVGAGLFATLGTGIAYWKISKPREPRGRKDK